MAHADANFDRVSGEQAALMLCGFCQGERFEWAWLPLAQMYREILRIAWTVIDGVKNIVKTEP